MAKAFTKLTRAAMRKLPVGGSLVEHGVTFDRLPDGDGRFSISTMVDGRRIHRVVGRESDGTTRTQVEEYLAKIRSDAKNDRLSLPGGRKLALAFAEAAKRYEIRLRSEGGKDLGAKGRRLRMHLVPFFGGIPLTKISGFDVERYKKQRCEEKAVKSKVKGQGPTYKESGAAAGTINRELAVLSHLFNKAVEWGWIGHVPARIRRFKEDSGRITYLTVEQAASLVECSKHDDSPQIYPFILIALETSMRLMEILSIRKENVDVKRRRIFIPNAKAGPREQPITPHLAEFLSGHIAALPNGTSWLFPSPAAKDGHTTNIRNPFRRVVKAADLDPDRVVRHTLRHTAITHLVQAGVDLPTIKRISGHKTLVMVERYAHANGEHIGAAMGKLEQRYRPQQGAAMEVRGGSGLSPTVAPGGSPASKSPAPVDEITPALHISAQG